MTKIRGVQIAAVRALGEIRDARAVEPLIDALQGKPEVVRTEVAWVLTKLTDKDFGIDYNLWKQWRRSQSPVGT